MVQTTSDGTHVDKHGEVKSKSRRDLVILNLPADRALSQYQKYCRDYVEHKVPVNIRNAMQSARDFWFDEAVGFYHHRVGIMVDELFADTINFLFDELLATALDQPTAMLPLPPPPACYRRDCPYKSGMARDMLGPVCYSTSCRHREGRAIPVPPSSAFGCLNESTDYAADPAMECGIQETCKVPRSVKMGVWASQHSTKHTETQKLEPGSTRTRREKAGIVGQLDRDTDIYFAFLMHAHDQVSTANIQRDVHYVQKHGRMHPDSKGRAWAFGKRVVGSVDFTDPQNQTDNGVGFYFAPDEDVEDLPYHSEP